jgi:predicted nuclease with TOPRIM domain
MRIPPDLQELIDREAQDSGVSRQKKLAEILEFYFSEPDTLGASRLAEELQKELASLEEHYAKLDADYEWLRGEYAILSTKLLPAAERTMTPWWRRLGLRFKRKKKD